MAIPNPNPNIRDYEQSDAFTWSSNKIKKEIYSAAELPEVSASDNGKVLGVVGGAWSVAENYGYIQLSDTLEASETSLVFTDDAITIDSIIDIYTDVFGVAPTNAEVTTGSLTLTFTAQVADVEVTVRIS